MDVFLFLVVASVGVELYTVAASESYREAISSAFSQVFFWCFSNLD